jgi:hypothetical protein
MWWKVWPVAALVCGCAGSKADSRSEHDESPQAKLAGLNEDDRASGEKLDGTTTFRATPEVRGEALDLVDRPLPKGECRTR